MRRYSWVPDVPDARDHLLVGKASTPRHVDLRDLCSPVEDQGELGSCTGNAIVGALEYLLLKEGAAYADLSRLFVYYLERDAENTVRIDGGAMIRTGVKQVHKHGVCDESVWPYDIGKFKRRPPKKAYEQALRRRTSEYLRVRGLAMLKRSLADGFPVVFGFSVYSSFETKKVERTGVVPLPRPREKMLGGHAVLAVGYDDDVKSVICRNSYGPGWGIEGCFLLPYGFVDSPDLSDDYWTIRR